jgi:hypothetical protein
LAMWSLDPPVVPSHRSKAKSWPKISIKSKMHEFLKMCKMQTWSSGSICNVTAPFPVVLVTFLSGCFSSGSLSESLLFVLVWFCCCDWSWCADDVDGVSLLLAISIGWWCSFCCSSSNWSSAD